jgi:Pyruvate/2-oxoacid:ferredoxin oxidoreductase delta subunit
MNQKDRIYDAFEAGYKRGHNDTVEYSLVDAWLAAEEYLEELALTALTAPRPEASDREIAEQFANELEAATRTAINFDPSCLSLKMQEKYNEQHEIEKAAWVERIVCHDAVIRADERRKAADRFCDQCGICDRTDRCPHRASIMGIVRSNASDTLEKIPEHEEHIVELPGVNPYLSEPGKHWCQLTVDYNAMTAEITIDGKTTKLVPMVEK